MRMVIFTAINCTNLREQRIGVLQVLQTVATAAASRHGGGEVLPTKFRLMITEANNDTYQGAIHVDSCRKDRVLVALVCQD